MNPQTFSIIGYVSVGLLLLLPILWLVHWKVRPRRWLCHIALVLTIVTFSLAKINSTTHVNRIEEDRSEQIARVADAIEKERKRKEEERSEDVADVRFIEDGGSDFLDKAGMDKSDAAYYGASTVDESQPKKKRQKVKREVADDESMLNALGGVEDKEVVDTSVVEEDIPEPIIMDKKEVALANQLDAMNLRFARWAIWFGLGFVLVDYLRRFHSYEDSYLPLPVSNTITQAWGAYPAVAIRPESARRDMLDELAMLVRQGATFLYLTDDSELSSSLPETLPRYVFNKHAVELLPANYDGEALSPDFIFEELWFGRTAFVEADPLQTSLILVRFSELLAERRSSAARSRRLVVLIWDREEAVPEVFEENIRILGPATGVHLFKC